MVTGSDTSVPDSSANLTRIPRLHAVWSAFPSPLGRRCSSSGSWKPSHGRGVRTDAGPRLLPKAPRSRGPGPRTPASEAHSPVREARVTRGAKAQGSKARGHVLLEGGGGEESGKRTWPVRERWRGLAGSLPGSGQGRGGRTLGAGWWRGETTKGAHGRFYPKQSRV